MGAKMLSKCAKMAPDGPRWPKDAPRSPQDGPKYLSRFSTPGVGRRILYSFHNRNKSIVIFAFVFFVLLVYMSDIRKTFSTLKISFLPGKNPIALP